MTAPADDKWKKLSFRNPLVWLGTLIAVLLVLRAVLPESYVTSLAAMLTSSGRCAMAREQLGNPRDAAAVCEYGIKTADPEAQIFVAGVIHQQGRDAEARDLLQRAAEQLLPRAEKGDGEAQVQLGWIYSYSILQNGREAGKWLCAASAQGSTEALMLLATMQGGMLFKALHEGPDSYDASETPAKFKAHACIPVLVDGKAPVVTFTGGSAAKLCPYRVKPGDFCDYGRDWR